MDSARWSFQYDHIESLAAPTQTTRYYLVVTNSTGCSDTSSVLVTVDTTTNSGGPIAYWPFNDNAIDETGNGHDGVVHGAHIIPDRFGNPKSAYDFEGGSSTFLRSADLTTGPGAQMTVCAWVKFCANQIDYAGIVDKGPMNTYRPGYELVIRDQVRITTWSPLEPTTTYRTRIDAMRMMAPGISAR